MRRLLAVSCLLAVPISAQAAAGDARGPAGDAIDVRADLQVAAPNPAAVAALRTSLGRDAIVSVDDRNGGLRMVGRLDGFLTPPSTADAADIALGYVRANRAAFGLSEADIDNLVLVRRVTSVGGLQRLFWQQRAVGGVPALDSGLRANVTADGRLVNVAGSPVSGVAAVQPAARLTSSQARVAALRGAVLRRSRRRREPATTSGRPPPSRTATPPRSASSPARTRPSSGTPPSRPTRRTRIASWWTRRRAGRCGAGTWCRAPTRRSTATSRVPPRAARPSPWTWPRGSRREPRR